MVNMCTRFVWLEALHNINTDSVARACQQVWSVFGFSKLIMSDGGKQLVEKVMESLKKMSHFEQRTFSPYHPSANGLAKKFVGKTMILLKKLLVNKTLVAT